MKVKLTSLRFLIGFLFLIAFFLSFIFPPNSFCEERYELKVDGLSCSFCAYGLERKLRKIDGVKNLEIIINEGKVILTSYREIPLDVIRKAVEDSGFTLRELKLISKEGVNESDQKTRKESM